MIAYPPAHSWLPCGTSRHDAILARFPYVSYIM